MHARIGQTVAVSLDGFRPGRYRIAGTAVFPDISDSLSLGRGATLSVAGLRRLLPPSLRPRRSTPCWCGSARARAGQPG